MDKIFKNKKTGDLYVLINPCVINATNAQDGEVMVLYRGRTISTLYARELNEFLDKFELSDMDELEFHYGEGSGFLDDDEDYDDKDYDDNKDSDIEIFSQDSGKWGHL